MRSAGPKPWSVALASALAACGIAAAPAAAAAHDVVHVVQRGRAIAVKVTFAGGEPIGDAAYEVFSPADHRAPHQEGRTDRNGLLSFVPDVAGAWRFRVVDGAGHGVDATVTVGDDDLRARAARREEPGRRMALGPIGGVGLIAALFAMLFLVQRRRAR